MFRALFYMILLVIGISVVRAVLETIGKLFSSFTSQAGPSPAPAGPKPTRAEIKGELKKDPVCGTFISTATAFQKAVGGQTYYFCSQQCRDKFNG
jgi:YHS domain-containing protein